MFKTFGNQNITDLNKRHRHRCKYEIQTFWTCHDYMERMSPDDARLVAGLNGLTLAIRGVNPSLYLLRQHCGDWETYHDRVVRGDFEEYGYTEEDL